MVNIRQRIFMICGAHYFGRQRAIENIKKRASNKTSSLNTFTFYSKGVVTEQIEQLLLNSSFAKTKIVLFRNFTALNSAIRAFLFSHYKKIIAETYLIFETEKNYYQLQKDRLMTADRFFSLIMKQASVIRVSSNERQVSLQDFIMSIRRHDLSSSLYTLERLCETEAKAKLLGPQIMGIIISHFTYRKNTPARNEQFAYLWQADRALKEKGIEPRLALETLLVKLFASL